MNVEIDFDRKVFYEQKKLWEESNITDYKYHLEALGFVGYSGTIIVENGNYKDNIPVNEYFEIDNYILNNYSTINEIYKTIENMFNDNNNKKKPMNDVWLDKIFVIYDKMNHIPIEIHYKYGYPVYPPIAIDGTFDYYINNFEKTN
jgi:hypothetical protein